MAYHLVAVDFLPPAVIQASLTRLAAEFASGGPTCNGGEPVGPSQQGWPCLPIARYMCACSQAPDADQQLFMHSGLGSSPQGSDHARKRIPGHCAYMSNGASAAALAIVIQQG